MSGECGWSHDPTLEAKHTPAWAGAAHRLCYETVNPLGGPASTVDGELGEEVTTSGADSLRERHPGSGVSRAEDVTAIPMDGNGEEEDRSSRR